MERLSSGGRLTIGTWLDNRRVPQPGGAWMVCGTKDYHYDQNQTDIDSARPFLNVGEATPAQDTC